MKLERYQRGVSALSVMTFLLLFASILTLTLKLVSLYLEDQAIGSVIQDLENTGDIGKLSDRRIKDEISKKLLFNQIRDFDLDAVTITRGKGNLDVDVVYEKRTHIVRNIDVVLSFEHHFSTRI